MFPPPFIHPWEFCSLRRERSKNILPINPLTKSRVGGNRSLTFENPYIATIQNVSDVLSPDFKGKEMLL